MENATLPLPNEFVGANLAVLAVEELICTERVEMTHPSKQTPSLQSCVSPRPGSAAERTQKRALISGICGTVDLTANLLG